MDVNKLCELVGRNKNLWMDLVEQNFKRNTYREPINVTAMYKDSVVHWNSEPKTPGQYYMNTLVLEAIAVETNFLIDYIKAAIEQKREECLNEVAKLVSKYETFLDANRGRRNENGYYELRF